MKHFSMKEFACPCCNTSAMHPDFLDAIDDARDEAGIPFVITSGYRCPEHNESVGGVEDSAHTRGYAADVSINTSRSRCKALRALLKRFPRVGIDGEFIHVDMDPEKPQEVVWLYGGKEQ